MFVTAALAAENSLKVKIGEPVTLNCTIAVEENENVATNEIEWKTLDQTVAKWLNGKFTVACGYEDRVNMPIENIKKGNLSLTITKTQMSDYIDFECLYKKQAKASWGLQIVGMLFP